LAKESKSENKRKTEGEILKRGLKRAERALKKADE